MVIIMIISWSNAIFQPLTTEIHIWWKRITNKQFCVHIILCLDSEKTWGAQSVGRKTTCANQHLELLCNVAAHEAVAHSRCEGNGRLCLRFRRAAIVDTHTLVSHFASEKACSFASFVFTAATAASAIASAWWWWWWASEKKAFKKWILHCSVDNYWVCWQKKILIPKSLASSRRYFRNKPKTRII